VTPYRRHHLPSRSPVERQERVADDDVGGDGPLVEGLEREIGDDLGAEAKLLLVPAR